MPKGSESSTLGYTVTPLSYRATNNFVEYEMRLPNSITERWPLKRVYSYTPLI